ncbi:MAG: FxsA family protein [Candidatus Nanopelagicales bacterium]
MGRFLALGALALLAVAEVAAVLALVDWIGGGPALAVLAADMFLGLFVIRWAVRSPQSERGWRMAAGAFICLPGLVLDVVGLVLLIPWVRGFLTKRVLQGTQSALNRRGVSVITVTDTAGTQRTTVVPGTVIQGEVVDPGQSRGPSAADPSPSGPATTKDRTGADAPKSGPSVVRGEIAGGE